jgi:hypothetical protein
MLFIDIKRRPVSNMKLFAAGFTLLIGLLVPLKSVPAADLGGITVRSGRFPSGAVTLRNGEYRDPAAPGSAAATVVKLTDLRAFSAVNGRDAAAVVIVTNSGGSGTFFDLALLVKGEGG